MSTPGVLFSTPNLLHEYSEVLRVLRSTSEYFGVLRSPAPKRLQNTTKVYKQTTWLCGRPLGIIVSNISE